MVGGRSSVVSSPTPTPPDSQTHTLLPAAAGAVMMILGLIFRVNQVNWLGLLTVLYAALAWALPSRYRRDIVLGLFLLYWVHPVPTQVFGPLQLAMQRLSVAGSEWLLHCLNVRVWADGMILRTGYGMFGVPESCSGMRTAVAVLMCSLGTALLFRLKWYEIIVALPFGLAQVLLLNIVRISFMVLAAPKMQRDWATTFLHDTAGILLLVAVFLTQAEVAGWRAYRVNRRRRNREVDVSIIPPIWILLKKIALALVVVLGIAAVLAGAFYKKRPYHRAMMIREVADNLADMDTETAERASRVALALQPDSHDFITQQVKILLLRRKFEEALTLLKRIPPNQWAAFDTILRAWGLMGVGQSAEAAALVDGLPEDSKSLPGVAMVRAEFAATRDDVAAVVSNITLAVQSPLMLSRVRGMYSYLAARQQWRTIIACHTGRPYDDVNQAIIAVHAHYQVNHLVGMARILKQAMEKWPGETGFIEYLAAMAIARPGSSWEDLFATRMKTCVRALNPDQMSSLIDGSFRINRPDLAWLVYNRLASVDPSHPALSLAVAQFGNVWFVFRKHYAGLPAQSEYETVDLGRFYFARRGWPEAPPAPDPWAASSAMRARSQNAVLKKMAGKAEKPGPVKEPQPASREPDAERALAAVAECVRSGDSAGALKLLQAAFEKWPEDGGFVRQLAALAADSPGGNAETLFEAQFKARMPAMNRDMLAAYVECAFLMTRPDLAWPAYARLKTMGPENPVLGLIAKQSQGDWYVFRTQAAGLDAAGPGEKTDLKKLYLLSRDWPEAPLAREMSAGDTALSRIGRLQTCLVEIERRKAAGPVSVQVAMMYATALGLAGRYPEAHAALDTVAAEYPDKRGEALFKHAVFYSTESEWQKVYESAREYSAQMMQPKLAATIMQIDALMRLDQGAHAMMVARRALKMFPGSPEVRQAIAAIWASFEFPEDALFELAHTPGWKSLPIATDLLWQSQRYDEARRVAQAYGRRGLPDKDPASQRVLMPRAESALETQWEAPLTAEEMNVEAGRLIARADKQGHASSFVGNLSLLKVKWYERQGQGDVSEPGSWEKTGRDDLERSVAMGELAMLLARQKRTGDALKAASRAVELAPDYAVMWRAIIGLSGGAPAMVARAYRECPDDPEIWLAWLVLRVRGSLPTPAGGAAPDTVRQSVAAAAVEERYPVGAMVRAGDFLRRTNMLAEAQIAASNAVARAEGLIPAYVLGFRCAVLAQDAREALKCTRLASVHAVDPWPFLEVTAELEQTLAEKSADTVAVLERLWKKFPDNAKWPMRLGDVYLRRGEADRALAILHPLIVGRSEGIGLGLLLLTAEAARKSGDQQLAVSLLEKAREAYPNSRIVLNNLVYTLAMDKGTLPRAQQLLPKLLETWNDNFAVYDTAAVVCGRAGDSARAKAYLEKALELAGNANPDWLRRNPSAVDIDAYLTQVDPGSDRQKAQERGFKELLPLAKELQRKIKVAGGE